MSTHLLWPMTYAIDDMKGCAGRIVPSGHDIRLSQLSWRHEIGRREERLHLERARVLPSQLRPVCGAA